MGLSSSIGLDFSLTTYHNVASIDGSVLMNLGTFATIANQALRNYILLVVDNGAYGSTGDKPTYTSGKMSLAGIAAVAGVRSVHKTRDATAEGALSTCLETASPHVIVVKVDPDSQR